MGPILPLVQRRPGDVIASQCLGRSSPAHCARTPDISRIRTTEDGRSPSKSVAARNDRQVNFVQREDALRKNQKMQLT